MKTTARDVMTTNVVAVREGTGYKEIVTLLRRHRVSAFPVLDAQDRVVGVVSGLIFWSSRPHPRSRKDRSGWRGALAERSKATGVTAAELMSTPVVTVSPAASVTQAAQLMQSRRVKRLPVVGQDGRLAGIISRTDVLSVFERPDEQIRDEALGQSILGRLIHSMAPLGAISAVTSQSDRKP
jgi:CBS domain-containing protein